MSEKSSAVVAAVILLLAALSLITGSEFLYDTGFTMPAVLLTGAACWFAVGFINGLIDLIG